MLIAFLTALFVALGCLIGGGAGMAMAFLFAAAMNLFAYWNSDKMVLSMYGAREADEAIVSHPSTKERIARLEAIAAGMGLVPQPSPCG